MKPRALFNVVRRNLMRMKMRVAMTSAGVLIGTAAIVLLVSLGIGLQNANNASMASFGELTELQVYSPNSWMLPGASTSDMNRDLVLNTKKIQEFKKIPGVVMASPLIDQSVSGLRWKRLTSGYTRMIGIDPQAIQNLNLEMQSGVARLGQNQVVIGSKVVETFVDPRTGKTALELVDAAAGEQAPDLQGQVLLIYQYRTGEDGKPVERQIRMRVAGVIAETGGEKDMSIYISSKDAIDMQAWEVGRRINYEQNGYNQVLIKAADAQNALKIEQELTSQGFYVFSLQSILRSNNMLFMIIQAVLGGLGGVALLVAGFGIANAMIMAIYERTREIGLMKAVGARNRDVLFIFLTEAGVIGLLGGVGGLLLGWVAGGLLNLVTSSYIASMMAQQGGMGMDVPKLVHTPMWLVLFALSFSTLIGIASGIYPALRATRLDPIQALRYE